MYLHAMQLIRIASIPVLVFEIVRAYRLPVITLPNYGIIESFVAERIMPGLKENDVGIIYQKVLSNFS